MEDLYAENMSITFSSCSFCNSCTPCSLVFRRTFKFSPHSSH